MDRFKFRAPSTSGLGKGSNQTTNWGEKAKNGTEPKISEPPKKSNDDDDLWNDEIDEMTLLQASQIGDTVEKVSAITYNLFSRLGLHIVWTKKLGVPSMCGEYTFFLNPIIMV